MVTKTNDEVQAMRDLIASGRLPPNAIEKYLAEEEENVFGKGFKRDRHGNPIEQGIGSALQPSRNSIEAYKAHQLGNKFGPESGFEEKLAVMEQALSAYEARKAAERAARKNARV